MNKIGALILCFWGSLLWGTFGQSVNVTFEISPPAHFKNYRRAYLSGNLPALGSWQAQGIELKLVGGKWRGRAQVPSGQTFEFKLNMGSWEYGETAASGGESRNHRGHCHHDCVVSAHVENFRLKEFHPVPQSASGHIEYLHDVHSEAFGNHRSVAIYLPPGYTQNPRQRYPVIYALDGDHLFDRATSSANAEWQIDETLNYYIARGKIPPVIVVGIYNTKRRADEFLHCHNSLLGVGGGAQRYGEFIFGKIKPVIDRYYRTLPDRDHTSVLGSSFGGVFATYASFAFSNFASRFGALSTAYWWDNYCIWDLLGHPYRVKPAKLWIDMGDREGIDDGATPFRNGVRDLKHASGLHQSKGGMGSGDLMTYVHKGAIHHERSWAERVGTVIAFLLSSE